MINTVCIFNYFFLLEKKTQKIYSFFITSFSTINRVFFHGIAIGTPVNLSNSQSQSRISSCFPPIGWSQKGKNPAQEVEMFGKCPETKGRETN
jgi:hypothetical protein